MNIRRRWACLGLAITDDAGNDEVWIIHHGAEGYAESISQFAPFVDTAWGFSVDVTENKLPFGVSMFKKKWNGPTLGSHPVR